MTWLSAWALPPNKRFVEPSGLQSALHNFHPTHIMKRYTSFEIEVFAKMYADGSSAAYIAKVLGRSVKAITNQISDMNTVDFAGIPGKTATSKLLITATDKARKLQGVRDTMRLPSATAKRPAWPFPVGSKPSVATQVPVTQLLPKPAKHRAAWDAAADKQLMLAFFAEKTPAIIAHECGRTVASIAGRLHALDLLIFDKDTLTYSTAPKFWYKVPA